MRPEVCYRYHNHRHSAGGNKREVREASSAGSPSSAKQAALARPRSSCCRSRRHRVWGHSRLCTDPGAWPGVAGSSRAIGGSLAELRGQVTDSTEAAIPNAKVTLTDLSKGTVRKATSDGAGNYQFIGLLPSQYE